MGVARIGNLGRRIRGDMKRKHRRLMGLALFLLGLGTAAALVLTAFEDNLVFFYSPSDVQAKELPPGARVRLGGLVAEGSITHGAGEPGIGQAERVPVRVHFVVTDLQNDVTVEYRGILPDLFREGQGVVAQGRFRPDGVFMADEVLAKHDENYMPPEVADSLERAGHPQGRAALDG